MYSRQEVLDLIYTSFAEMCPAVHLKKSTFFLPHPIWENVFHPRSREIPLVKDRRIMTAYLHLVKSTAENCLRRTMTTEELFLKIKNCRRT